MSILDFPRIHFRGWARVNAPTANRDPHGQIDMAGNAVFIDGQPFDLARHPTEFHRHLQALQPRFGLDGRPDPAGPFSLAEGYNAAGNNHFSWENAAVSHVELDGGGPDRSDGLVGAKLALWGHYNDYLRTTFNRARWVDNDPTRRDAAQIYAGQFTISPAGAGPGTPWLFTADIEEGHGARWTRGGHVAEKSGHFLDDEFGLVRLFQFSVSKQQPHFLFHPRQFDSEVWNRLQRELESDDALGLTVQYALFNMSTPPQPNSPVFHDMVGVVGLWRRGELASYPAGRLLRPSRPGLGDLTLKVGGGRAALNLACAIPFSTRAEQPSSAGVLTPDLGGKLPLGDLLLRDEGGALLARVPQALYQDYWANHGIIDLPLLREPKGSLTLSSELAEWREQDWVTQSDASNLYLEAPDRRHGRFFPENISLRSYFRGEARERASIPYQIEGMGLVGVESRQDGIATEWRLTGLRPGPARIVLGDGEEAIRLRVLPDDWALDDATVEEVDYAFLYRHVMAYYELVYPFMSDKVFSLADRCKCETYARLMWQMCDPQNRGKSYYMPSTRELSAPKARLFLKYLAHVEGEARLQAPPPAGPARIASKAELAAELRKAVDLELSVMLQYLYAAYSIPNYAQGQQRVADGAWTPEQLQLACGGGDRRRDGGIRAALLEIAHEEMIHYLVVNNLLMALGEPFYAGVPLMGEAARQAFGLDTEFALEPFSESALARFVRLEWPHFIPAPGKSIADFYAAIRQAFLDLPDLFDGEAGKRGGEHHLFLNELTNRANPGYQLEVFDRDSALFGIAFVTDQGEGGALDSPHYEHSHFQRLRELAARIMAQPAPFEPALPALRNPVLDEEPGCQRVRDERARALMGLYQGVYELMFAMMAQHFAVKPLGSLRRSRLMNAAIDLMTGLLRPLSCALMNLPSGIAGRTAGPPLPGPADTRNCDDYALGCKLLARRCERLLAQASMLEPGWLPDAQLELLDFYRRQMLDLACGKLSREA
ncbi:iminophenyl-pyruvate dimer synthase VioB [Chromobacterium phragmitis]|uniref:iminophenyl-pyruvate dimer synthase VioB n=1 Tax=Chromobacterium phragmitis TaxID=2202141 RepID=UPI000DEC7A6F|nr:iminophenyl-pyruvate dimer synthase VioB [Chromobacterium phragmitis]AXE28659.1 iminophenyl-pyruvate dimer synthase VioB [Chromobacterium phragmitis]